MVGPEADTVAIAELKQEAHSATPTLKLRSACWLAVGQEVVAWVQPAPALRIGDKP